MKRSQKFLRLASLLCVLALSAALTTGCSGNAGGKEKSTSAAHSSEAAAAEVSREAAAGSEEAAADSATQRGPKKKDFANPDVDNAKSPNEAAAILAKQYIHSNPFSRKGLIEQLEFEGCSNDVATYGADHCDADWKEQAARDASYTAEKRDYSPGETLKYLKDKEYTEEEAKYGAEHCDVDWNQIAARRAKEHQEFMVQSKDPLVRDLLDDGFTKEQAEFGAQAVGAK